MTPDLPYAARLAECCRAVRDECPVPPSWPAAGRAWPRAQWVSAIRAAGWPVVESRRSLPHSGHGGIPAGKAVQPVVLVPREWLVDLARRMGQPWHKAHREFT